MFNSQKNLEFWKVFGFFKRQGRPAALLLWCGVAGRFQGSVWKPIRSINWNLSFSHRTLNSVLRYGNYIRLSSCKETTWTSWHCAGTFPPVCTSGCNQTNNIHLKLKPLIFQVCEMTPSVLHPELPAKAWFDRRFKNHWPPTIIAGLYRFSQNGKLWTFMNRIEWLNCGPEG